MKINISLFIIKLFFLRSEMHQITCQSQWPRGLSYRSVAARLLRLWVRILPGGMNVCRDCCVLSRRVPYDGLITRPEDPYRLWYVVVCDLETS